MGLVLTSNDFIKENMPITLFVLADDDGQSIETCNLALALISVNQLMGIKAERSRIEIVPMFFVVRVVLDLIVDCNCISFNFDLR